ncbi:GAF sensor protein [Candidatus Omnitrophus magneticus]|uniref:GAF sensor protein n=2 Tax=Candidatus Omnitrophus magneticus TaxID=1609969 RepID=A0A0F0CKB7_9BACT|nr:GAF sensor protein [Candidatus Omnitrophus magneticus]KJJ83836.1 GAF sensor protein [Candidatus Omnitrophus magneticus]KJJ84288.1 GAF sensor protein [Candidatus Omnitrophus magneticus]KJJ84432.1 GAF sensor protein [Candidatus Omnitrophus magneticus]KJJ84625.1 GAF sensor protein [Candidatus Omnitrophus magneticus]
MWHFEKQVCLFFREKLEGVYMKKTSEDYLDTLTKISKAITADLYLEDILKLIVSLTAGVMGAKICALWLLDEKKQELKIRATQAMSPDYLRERIIKVGEGIVGLVARDKQAIAILKVLEDPRYKEKELAKKENFVSMLSVPMVVKDRVIGVINCYTTQEYEFMSKDIDLLSAVANQAAVAIQNTELLVQTKIIQEELETRKKVEKAKGLLMKAHSIEEDEAYRMMRKASMDRRVTMKEIAEAVILTYELKKK